MELYAVAWALTFCIKPAKVTFLTNNLAVKRWLEKGEVNEDYADIYEYCKKLSQGIEIKYEHIKKARMNCRISAIALHISTNFNKKS